MSLTYDLVLGWEKEIDADSTFSKKWFGVGNATVERATKKRRELALMLAKRPTVEVPVTVSHEVYRRLGKIIRDEIDWPTDHFLLDDELGAST